MLQTCEVCGPKIYGYFYFDIEFHNLAPVELGALIYVLELEEGMHHRLGLAKPLGFGSVSVKIDELELIDWKEGVFNRFVKESTSSR